MKHSYLFLLVCIVLVAQIAGCGPTLEERKQRAETQFDIGAAELNRGRFPEAFEAMQKARDFYPDDPRFSNALGLIALYQQRYPDAIQEFRRALELDPNFTEAHNNLGTTYAQSRKWDEAIHEFRETLSDPFYPTPELAHYNLGMALIEKGEVIEAVKELHIAVELNPEFTQAVDKYGLALFRLNRIQEAVKQFHRALELDPVYMEARLNLGLAYMKQDKTPEAIAEFKIILEHSTDGGLKESAQRYLEILE
jgi:Tfp pilus assembly protein PilF